MPNAPRYAKLLPRRTRCRNEHNIATTLASPVVFEGVQVEVTVLQVGADGRGDAVALRVEVVADFHRVARLELIVILVHRRFEEERIATLGVTDPHDSLEHRLGKHGRFVGHERPHLLIGVDRRCLRPTHTTSRLSYHHYWTVLSFLVPVSRFNFHLFAQLGEDSLG